MKTKYVELIENWVSTDAQTSTKLSPLRKEHHSWFAVTQNGQLELVKAHQLEDSIGKNYFDERTEDLKAAWGTNFHK